ncbi:hypothetical protein ACTFIW_005601 [Dictyostelium discoideum]
MEEDNQTKELVKLLKDSTHRKYISRAKSDQIANKLLSIKKYQDEKSTLLKKLQAIQSENEEIKTIISDLESQCDAIKKEQEEAAAQVEVLNNEIISIQKEEEAYRAKINKITEPLLKALYHTRKEFLGKFVYDKDVDDPAVVEEIKGIQRGFSIIHDLNYQIVDIEQITTCLDSLQLKDTDKIVEFSSEVEKSFNSDIDPPETKHTNEPPPMNK